MKRKRRRGRERGAGGTPALPVEVSIVCVCYRISHVKCNLTLSVKFLHACRGKGDPKVDDVFSAVEKAELGPLVDRYRKGIGAYLSPAELTSSERQRLEPRRHEPNQDNLKCYLCDVFFFTKVWMIMSVV